MKMVHINPGVSRAVLKRALVSPLPLRKQFGMLIKQDAWLRKLQRDLFLNEFNSKPRPGSETLERYGLKGMGQNVNGGPL